MKILINEKISAHRFKDNNGNLICTDCILSRTGKQSYRKSEIWLDTQDDSEIEVNRSEEEVFSPKTLASFENCYVTLNHPDEDVNPENYKDYSVGFVRNIRKGDFQGQPVMIGDLVIMDQEVINLIEEGKFTDLSCGYDCDIIDEENPQQRNIRGNHVALCQCGRAGIARIVDSIKTKDSDYRVDVSGASDREVSMFINEAQNIGFTTRDKGQEVVLMNGDERMLQKLKQKTNSNIKFVDAIKDAEMINWEGKKVIIVKNPQEVFEDALVKEYVTYNGKKYWWFEGKSGRNYFVPQGTFDDSIKDKAKVVKVDNGNKIVQAGTTGKIYAEKSGSIWWIKKQGRVIKHVDSEFEAISIVQAAADLGDSYTNFEVGSIIRVKDPNQWQGIKKAKVLKDLNELVEIDLEGKVYKTHKSNILEKIEDKLIQSSSEEAFKKNVAEEVRSGKDPKQAVAIAYSIKRKNDSTKDSYIVEGTGRYGTVYPTSDMNTKEFDDIRHAYKFKSETDAKNWIDRYNRSNQLSSRMSFKVVKVNDSLKKFEISYTKDSIEYIHIIKAKSFEDAISKFKGGK